MFEDVVWVSPLLLVYLVCKLCWTMICFIRIYPWTPIISFFVQTLVLKTMYNHQADSQAVGYGPQDDQHFAPGILPDTIVKFQAEHKCDGNDGEERTEDHEVMYILDRYIAVETQQQGQIEGQVDEYGIHKYERNVTDCSTSHMLSLPILSYIVENDADAPLYASKNGYSLETMLFYITGLRLYRCLYRQFFGFYD